MSDDGKLAYGRLQALPAGSPGPTVIPRLAFGCEQLGGYQWGDIDVHDIEAALIRAVELGIKLFDTADCYGRGESERRLGRILSRVRDRVMIATKFGVRFRADGTVYYDSSPAWAERSLYDSLSRLGTDYLDLFQIHYWDQATPITATFEGLEKLREMGLIRSYGITNYAPDLSGLADQFPGLASVSLEYSLVERSSEEYAEQVLHHGLNFLSYGSLGQGVLSGKYGIRSSFSPGDRRARTDYRNFHGERFRANLALVAALREHAQALSLTLPQLAIVWILNRIPGSIPLIGIKTVQQVEDAFGALSRMPVPPTSLMALDRLSRAAFQDKSSISENG